jgi:hypothetical protein
VFDGSSKSGHVVVKRMDGRQAFVEASRQQIDEAALLPKLQLILGPMLRFWNNFSPQKNGEKIADIT